MIFELREIRLLGNGAYLQLPITNGHSLQSRLLWLQYCEGLQISQIFAQLKVRGIDLRQNRHPVWRPFSKACLALVDKLSTYFRCPSAAKTSNTKDDFPDPLTPVTPTNLPLGKDTVTSRRLFSLAPLTKIFFE